MGCPVLDAACGLTTLAADAATAAQHAAAAAVHAVTFRAGVALVGLLAPAILVGAAIAFGADDHGSSPGRAPRERVGADDASGVVAS
jgi:hypothetical protein